MRRVPRVTRSLGVAKPKVLLVDDHRGVLNKVSAILAHDFDVAGLANDGAQALDAMNQVRPDVIVLDVEMPGLDGFQTKRALEQAGSRAPVVFLSATATDEVIGEAFRSGGRGYVLKSHVVRDLASTLDHVLSGRLFAPSLSSVFRLANGGGHATHLHGDIESFLDDLAACFDLALRQGDATCVIATEDMREGLGRRLRAAGWDLGSPAGHKRYLVIDVADAVSRFMRNGRPDAGIVAEIASELDQYRREATDGTPARLTIFGNIAESLTANGNPTAAIALESQWNALTRELPFFTLCGYSTGCFHDGVSGLWSSACQEHWAVSHAPDL
jgi:DNA-binding NarL/FixJ family response regulator